jgi:AcrR family transcriptional regulator
MGNNSQRQSGLSREKWLELAVDTLSIKSKSKFSLDSLIKSMPVTKGSFYWHFKDRAEFLFALVDYWGRHDTKIAIKALEALPKAVSASQKLWELMCVIYELNLTAHELMIRTLVQEFPDLEPAVAAVYQSRYNTVRQIFSELGFEGDDLEMRTLLFASSASRDQLMFLEFSDEDFERQLKLRHDFFIRP